MKDTLAFMLVILVLGGFSLILIGFNAFRQWVEKLSVGIREAISTVRDRFRDPGGFPSPQQTPTHADPRGLAKQLFCLALRDYGVSDIFLEWIRVDPSIDGESHLFLVTPGGRIFAFGTFTGDERDGWIEIHYYTDQQGTTRWLTPKPTKETP